MPYIHPSEQYAIEQGAQPTTVGQLNWLITKELIKRWKVQPRYTTAHALCHAFVMEPKNNDFLKALSRHNAHFTWMDVQTAAYMAFQEFYRRVVARYEQQKAKENGDVYEKVEVR